MPDVRRGRKEDKFDEIQRAYLAWPKLLNQYKTEPKLKSRTCVYKCRTPCNTLNLALRAKELPSCDTASRGMKGERGGHDHTLHLVCLGMGDGRWRELM